MRGENRRRAPLGEQPQAPAGPSAPLAPLCCRRPGEGVQPVGIEHQRHAGRPQHQARAPAGRCQPTARGPVRRPERRAPPPPRAARQARRTAVRRSPLPHRQAHRLRNGTGDRRPGRLDRRDRDQASATADCARAARIAAPALPREPATRRTCPKSPLWAAAARVGSACANSSAVSTSRSPSAHGERAKGTPEVGDRELADPLRRRQEKVRQLGGAEGHRRVGPDRRADRVRRGRRPARSGCRPRGAAAPGRSSTRRARRKAPGGGARGRYRRARRQPGRRSPLRRPARASCRRARTVVSSIARQISSCRAQSSESGRPNVARKSPTS